MNKHTNEVTIAMTGASGIIYALRLIEYLLQKKIKINVLMSSAAHAVAVLEYDIKLPSQTDKLKDGLVARYNANPELIQVYSQQEWTASIASGSAKTPPMVICPCSMGCVAAIAQGSSDNLIERAADVVIKEQSKLILVPRETPLSPIHLENLLKLSRIGVVILPPTPGFYHKPETINDLVDFVVARILDHLLIEQDLIKPWSPNA